MLNRILGSRVAAPIAISISLLVGASLGAPAKLLGASATPPVGQYTELAALARDSNGEIFAAGTSGACPAAMSSPSCSSNELLLARFFPEGSPDPSFGLAGVATASLSGASGLGVDAVTVAPDGDVLLAGSAALGGSGQRAILLARFSPNGALDSSFGSGGIVTFAPPGALVAEPEALAVQPDGAVLVAGRSAAAGTGGNFLLARFLPGGVLDPSFAQGGYATAFQSASASEAGAMALEPDGRIVVAGDVSAPREGAFALARYLPDGQLDPSFGAGGLLTRYTVHGDFGSARVRSLALLPGGDFLIAGISGAGPHLCPQVTLARLQPEGAPDRAFGSKGVARPEWIGDRGACGEVTAEAALPSGASLVAGRAASGEGLPLLLSRYTAAGRVDPHFGARDGGVELAAPGGGSFTGAAALLGGEGASLVVGTAVKAARCYGVSVASSAPCEAIVLSRLRPGGALDRSFGDDGAALVPRVRLCRPAALGARPCRALLTAQRLERAAEAILPRSATLGRRALVVRLRCPRMVATSCRATAVARRGRHSASGRSSPTRIASGDSRLVRLPLDPAQRRALADKRKLILREEVSADHGEAVVEGAIRLH